MMSALFGATVLIVALAFIAFVLWVLARTRRGSSDHASGAGFSSIFTGDGANHHSHHEHGHDGAHHGGDGGGHGGAGHGGH